MSTTISAGDLLKQVQTPILIALTLVAGWFSVMLLAMAIFEPTDTALVIVRDHSILERLPTHISFTATGDNTITLRSSRPGFVTDIYKAGGMLVFPALANGCVNLRN